MVEQQLEVKEREYRPGLRPGPPKKDRTAIQFTMTMGPELYDKLKVFMKSRNTSNRSAAVCKLVETAIDLEVI